MQQIRSIAVLLGLALALSLGSLAYEQVRTQRAKDTATIQRLRQQLSEESEAHHRALAATGSAPAVPVAMPVVGSATGGTQVTGGMGGTTFGAVPGAAPALGAAHSFIHTIDSLPYSKGDLVMMSFATGGVRDMLDNWVRHPDPHPHPNPNPNPNPEPGPDPHPHPHPNSSPHPNPHAHPDP